MNRIKVAIVEDHHLTRLGICSALKEQQDIQVVGEADTASTGLEILRHTQPDIAIVDIGLPDMDGIALINQFRKIVSTAQGTKIIVLTSFSNEQMVMAAFAAGADSYCVKTIKLDLLLEVVWMTYQGESWIDSSIARIVLKNVRPLNLEHNIPMNMNVNYLDHQSISNLKIEPLTNQELLVLELIVQGYKNTEICQQLHISLGTVKFHIRNILNKMCANDRTQAAVKALRLGLCK